LQHEVIVEKMSGEVQDVEVSAISGQGLDELLEAIALQAEILELKANPDRAAEGAVIEAQLDVGRGPVATVLVQKGTLKQGDIFVVGEQWGKVRALINDKGDRVKEAGPSVPVEVLGLNGTPEAGDVLNVVETEAQAREIAEYREQAAKEKRAAAGAAPRSTSFWRRPRRTRTSSRTAHRGEGRRAGLGRGDRPGDGEDRQRRGARARAALRCGRHHRKRYRPCRSLRRAGHRLQRPGQRAGAQSANQKGVEIRYYSVIYDLVDDVKAAASGLLGAEIARTSSAMPRSRRSSRSPASARSPGCLVTEGVARRSAGVRLLRDDVVIHEGTLKTLKRFKDEVKEVQSGQECGMAFENYDDIREGDVIEIFEREEVERDAGTLANLVILSVSVVVALILGVRSRRHEKALHALGSWLILVSSSGVAIAIGQYAALRCTV
jgi:translation initiation factor IF-2